MQSQKNTSGTSRAAAGEQGHRCAKRAASTPGSASEGPPNTPQNGNEAAGAQYDVVEHATPLDALPSGLPKSAIAERDGNPANKLSDASLSPPPTENNGERGAVHCEQEHDNANVAATPEGSISPETPRSAPENDIKEATLRRNGDGPSASRLAALLSELEGLRCSPADQDSGDSDGPSCTCESTDSMPSPATSLSEHDELYFAFADMSNAIPATAVMVLIDGQSP